MQATLERLKQRRADRGDEGGFTLIELLIVIVILAILAAIVVFAVQNLSGTSAQASCTSDFKTVQTGIEAYKAQMGAYPFGGGNVANVSSATATDNVAVGTVAAQNAAAANSILMSPSDAAPNLKSPSGQVVGPWLKTVPVNGNHYAIAVSNDGLGTIQVQTVAAGAASGAAVPAANGAAAGSCGAVS
jgi:general secretion pathway protein G